MSSLSSPSPSSCCGGGGPMKGFCPFSLFLFVASAGLYYYHHYQVDGNDRDDNDDNRDDNNNKDDNDSGANANSNSTSPYSVIFVLGGPGSGKGTQCQLLTDRTSNLAHLSAGDLLRAERQSGSDLAGSINDAIASGGLVPAEITVDLLVKAMRRERADNGTTRFVIDGFPRSEGNVAAWNERMDESKANVEFVLFLDCPEETMTGRLLERGKSSGRNDDNLDVIRKRFETFRSESMPIVDMYDKMGKLRTVRADRSVEDVYKHVSALMKEGPCANRNRGVWRAHSA